MRQTGEPVDLYFFDLDKTLYAYDFRRRLPELSRLTGVSQYRLARSWWADGYEGQAEAGRWATSEEYLDAFAEVTGGRRLSLEQWTHARQLAMTRIDGGMAAVRLALSRGAASLLSNNPPPLLEALPVLAPDVVELLGDNILVSCTLGARKPSAELFQAALDHYSVDAANAFLLDDSAANVAGARALGMTAHRLEWIGDAPQTDAALTAIDTFSRRNS